MRHLPHAIHHDDAAPHSYKPHSRTVYSQRPDGKALGVLTPPGFARCCALLLHAAPTTACRLPPRR